MESFKAVGEFAQLAFWIMGVVAAAAIAYQRLVGRTNADGDRITRLENDMIRLNGRVDTLAATIAHVDKGVAVLLERTKHLEREMR